MEITSYLEYVVTATPVLIEKAGYRTCGLDLTFNIKRGHNFVLPLKDDSNFIPRMLHSNIY